MQQRVELLAAQLGADQAVADQLQIDAEFIDGAVVQRIPIGEGIGVAAIDVPR